jgi:hypothetical protein
MQTSEIESRLVSVETENEQLRTALESRIAIEQAKGILAERYRLGVEEAFGLLRYSARSAQMDLHELARLVLPGAASPHQITVGVTRAERWRAAGQRERAEAIRERAADGRARSQSMARMLREQKKGREAERD